MVRFSWFYCSKDVLTSGGNSGCTVLPLLDVMIRQKWGGRVSGRKGHPGAPGAGCSLADRPPGSPDLCVVEETRRSSWELPDLQEGKIEAISDSDGVNYPWYGNTTETCTIVGPTKRDSKFSISMNDNFYPSVTWAVPVSESNVAKLTNIYRDQSFTTWLVATNISTNDMVILQTLHWRMQLSIEVNPSRPLGQRARLREPVLQDQPKILSKNEPIPPNALVKPNANDAQVLMWRPKYGQPLVVIPPKHR
ncbi:PREDICTED: protein FAM78A isoform X2 [Hipposideros armiger]|uniref:Protein FAM78A isoform X2 n=1 Tax=Hipposideros armiger TaxID=186990 RepID=A0A8B7R252_HIPAR|nr:PREDICTED: protein FAM78A isoform X2 [Hipposideros armiger]